MPDAAAAPSPRYNPQRAFIRHTAGVPLEIRSVPGAAASTPQSVNVSAGGLSFVCDTPPELGSIIQVRIPTVDPPFQAQARMKPEDDAFCVGVQFLDASDAFRARMVEQVCAIERYRCQVRDGEGRDLSPQDAAAEWIARYGGRFPDASGPPG